MHNTTRAFLLIAVLSFPFNGRCQSFGTIDESYASSGVAIFNDHGSEYPLDLVLRPNGSEYILSVDIDLGTATILAVTPEGSPDNSFSGDGWLSVSSPNEDVGFLDGKVDASGRLVVFGGVGPEEPDFDPLIQRYQTNGSLDASFGGPQGLRLSYPGGAVAVDGAILLDGKMVVLLQSFGENSAVLVKLSSTGQVETGFGTNGYALIAPLAGMEVQPEHLLVLPSGKFMVGANMDPVDEGTSPACFVQLTATGELDGSFGEDGWLVIDLAPGTQPWLDQTFLADMGLLPGGDVSAILSAPSFEELDQLVSIQIPADGADGCLGLDPVTEEGYQAECAVTLAGGTALVCSSLYNNESRVAHVIGDCHVDQSLGGTGFIPMTGLASLNAYPEVMVRRNDGRVDVLMSVFSLVGPSYSVIVRLHADDVAGVADAGASAAVLRIEPQPVTGDVLHIRSIGALDKSLQLVGLDGRWVTDPRSTVNSDGRYRVEIPPVVGNGTYILRGMVDAHPFARAVIVQR